MVKRLLNYRSTIVPKEARRYSTYDNVGQQTIGQGITLKQLFVINSPLEGCQSKIDGMDRVLNVI
jgi:hypothetical protein